MKRALLVLACAGAAFSHGAFGAFTEEEKQVLARQVKNYTNEGAGILKEHGAKADVDALEYAIATYGDRLVGGLVNDWPKDRADALQSIASEHFQDGAVTKSIFGRLQSTPITDRKLFDLLYSDVVALAKWRAERRERCKYVIDPGWNNGGGNTESARTVAVPEGGVTLLVKCPRGSEGLSAKRPSLDREMGSARYISAAPFPETRNLLPLFRDLSIAPTLEQPPGARRLPFLRLEASTALPAISVNHRWPIPLGQLLDVMDILEASAPKAWMSAAPILDALAVHDSEPRAGQLIVRWTEYAINADGPDDERTRFVTHNLKLLAAMAPSGQVPLGSILSTATVRLPRSRMEIKVELDRTERLNAGRRDPRHARLVEYINEPAFRSLVPDLIANGAPVNGVDRQLPLITAIAVAPDMVPMLVEHGADVNGNGDDGAITPLMAAVRIPGHDDVVLYLLSHGADPNLKARTSLQTPLHACKDPATMRILLEHGGKASVNAKDHGQWTPLHFANAQVAKVLLDAGADPNAENYEGESPYSIAYEGRDEELKKLLADRGGRMSPAQTARHAAGRAYGEMLKRALENGGRM